MTALYEIMPVGVKPSRTDPLRYQMERERVTPRTGSHADELAFVKLRYKLPGEATSRLLEQPVSATDVLAWLGSAPVEQCSAVAVAAFAQRLRGESVLDSFPYDAIAKLTIAAGGADPEGYRAGFVHLVHMAETLSVVSQR